MSVLETASIFLAPKIGLKPEQIWPVSKTSAPFLISLWAILVTSIYRLLFLETKNVSYNEALRRRRKHKKQALRNLIYFEETRLVRSRNSKTKEHRRDAATDASDELDDPKDDPPTASHVYDVLFEKVEEQPVWRALNIPPDDPLCSRGVALLRHRARAELEEAKTRTWNAARTATSSRLGTTNTRDERTTLDYQDGEKLAKVLEFTKNKAIKHFGEHTTVPTKGSDGRFEVFDDAYSRSAPKELRFVDESALAEAEDVLRRVRATQKHAFWFIVDIVRPVLPTYGVAIFFVLMARAFEGPLWARLLPSYKASVATINPDAEEGEFGHGPEVLRTAEGHALLFAVGYLFFAPLNTIGDALGDRAARDFSKPLRKAVMGALMRQDTEYFDHHSSAALRERLNRDTNELVDHLLGAPRRVLEHAFRVLQRCATLYFVAPAMLWACLKFNVPLFAVVVFFTSKRLRLLCGLRDRVGEHSAAETMEILQNVKMVRQFSMESKEQEKYSVQNITRNIVESRIRVLESLTYAARHAVHATGELYVVYVALVLAVKGEADVSDAIVASTVGMWLQHDANNLMEQIPKLVKIMKPIHRISSLLACKPRIETFGNENPGLLRPNQFKGHIEFRDVTFSYPKERQKLVLNGLSFTASPGQKIAFVGKAGCGKSTSIELLQRFYHRNGGEIRIDGRLIEEYDTSTLRKHSGVVSQTNVLLARSIYENIVYGLDDPPGPESKEFINICRKAECWEFIEGFPNKQYTMVGEEGVRLSGGQKQRIAIARVIARKPTFIFLDEATSALDAINEKAVQKSLDEMLGEFNGVAIVVAHRLTTICDCDKIVVIGEDGKVVEQGTHEELLRAPKKVDDNGKPVAGPGLYHTLWDTQQMEGKHTVIKELRTQLDAQRIELKRREEEIDRLKEELRQNRRPELRLPTDTISCDSVESLRLSFQSPRRPSVSRAYSSHF